MSVNVPRNNRVLEIVAEQKLIDGLVKNAASITAFLINGVNVPRQDMVTTLQGRIDKAKQVDITRAEWLSAIAAHVKTREDTKTFVSGLRQALLVAFGGQVNTLADFGLTRRKTVIPDSAHAGRGCSQGQGHSNRPLHYGQEPEGRHPRRTSCVHRRPGHSGIDGVDRAGGPGTCTGQSAGTRADRSVGKRAGRFTGPRAGGSGARGDHALGVIPA